MGTKTKANEVKANEVKVCSEEEIKRAIDIVIAQHLEAFKELAKD